MGSLLPNSTVIKTIVTTDIIFDMAKEFDLEVKEVLTGFKYIGESLETTKKFVLGLEESYGYLVGTHARDKDAVSAAMMISSVPGQREAAAFLYAFSMTSASGVSVISLSSSASAQITSKGMPI